MLTSEQQFEWARSQDVQIIYIDRNPDLDDYIVTIHYKNSRPPRLLNYPLAQAKDLFPTLIAWHIHMTSGSSTSDPKLRWAVDHWRSVTTRNVPEIDIQDLNILSNLRAQASNKKAKLSHLSTEIIVEIRHGEKLNKRRNLKALIDTGSSGCIILNEFTAGIHHKQSEGTQQWMTKGGIFSTSGTCPVKFYLPEFSTQECIKWKFHVDNSVRTTNTRYDMILGRDILEQLPLDIKFSDRTLSWQDRSVPMKTMDELDKQNINEIVEQCYQSVHLNEISRRTMEILDAKYEKANLSTVVSACEYLNRQEKAALLRLLLRHEDLFDGSLGTWNGPEVHIKLKRDAIPQFSRPFPVPQVHEKTFKIELDRLVELGVLKWTNARDWAAPTFIIPKKDGSVRFISDFRKLNKWILRSPFPIPKIQDMLHKLEGFMYATSLDLNMGYYHIKLDPDAQKYCMIITPWGCLSYLRLPMGLSSSADIFKKE